MSAGGKVLCALLYFQVLSAEEAVTYELSLEHQGIPMLIFSHHLQPEPGGGIAGPS